MYRLLLIFVCFSFPLFSEQVLVVGIAGGTASGKTRLAQIIQEKIGAEAILIQQDSYYKDHSHIY